MFDNLVINSVTSSKNLIVSSSNSVSCFSVIVSTDCGSGNVSVSFSDKIPANIVENFGNPGSASIPAVTTYNYGALFQQEYHKVCFSAFGAGLTCACIIMDLGCLNLCKMIEYK